MKNIKLFVFDVGNTLIDTKQGISISNQVLKDLNTLRNKGYILGISTLRTEEMIAPILLQFDFEFLILMNGGLVKIGERVVYSQPLGNDLIEEIKKQALACRVAVKDFVHKGQIYALELLDAKERFIVRDAYQAYVWERSGNIDITSKGITKLQGLKIVCREFGILPEEMIAFGDGYNDIEMLKAAGISIAMGNAPDEVCAAATMTTATAGEDGI